MARTDGKKIVGLAFAGMVGAIGIAQVYLPYIADRDKLRGLFEEEDMPSEAKHELDMMMRAEKAAMEAQQDAEARSGKTKATGGGNCGSMWQKLRRN